MEKRKGLPCIAIGIITGALGAVFCFAGNGMNNDYKRQINSFFSSGSKDGIGDALITFGAVFIVIGIILVIIGIILYASSGVYTTRQPAGGRLVSSSGIINLFGTYVNSDGRYSVVFEKNGRCVWYQNGEKYLAQYIVQTPNQWTISIDGFGPAFTAVMTSGGLSIKGGSLDDVFIRQG